MDAGSKLRWKENQEVQPSNWTNNLNCFQADPLFTSNEQRQQMSSHLHSQLPATYYCTYTHTPFKHVQYVPVNRCYIPCAKESCYYKKYLKKMFSQGPDDSWRWWYCTLANVTATWISTRIQKNKTALCHPASAVGAWWCRCVQRNQTLRAREKNIHKTVWSHECVIKHFLVVWVWLIDVLLRKVSVTRVR